MKALVIAKRLPDGWTEYQPNDNTTHCDDCGARLWVAPDGKTLYCDALSTKHERRQHDTND